MKRTSAFLMVLTLAAPLMAGTDTARAPQLPPIDAGTIQNQINNQHPFPQPNPTTLDTCALTGFTAGKCTFKCQSGAVLAEPAVKPDIAPTDPAAGCASYIIRPIPAQQFKSAGFDMNITRPLMMAKMQSNTLRTVALMLNGLDQQNSPNKAPADYTLGVNDASEAINESLLNMDAAINEKDGASLHMETMNMEPVVAKLANLAKVIEGDANYKAWGGESIKNIAAELGRDLDQIRVNAPFAF